MQNITEWLTSLNLAQYSISFEQNDINLALLSQLTSDDLKEIGVLSVGHRRVLLEAIKTLSKNNDVLDEGTIWSVLISTDS